MKILLGFYYGIGDFISSIPIVRELSKSHAVTIAIGNQNKGLIELIDIGEAKVIFFPLFSPTKLPKIISFMSELKKEKFDKILVSPHAQDAVTSWKIPLMLKYIKSSNTKIVGAIGDRNSFLYDVKIPINKSIALMQREIDFIKLSGLIDIAQNIDITNIFLPNCHKQNNSISIHPGASKTLREWKHSYYVELVNLILNNTDFKVVFIGLETELATLKNKIHNQKVEFISSTFKEAIDKISQSQCVVTMDSGFGHIASALGINHIVLVGSANPEHIKPIFKNTTVLNVKKLSCQPCNGHHCHVGHNYCMDLITPELVFNKIIEKGK